MEHNSYQNNWVPIEGTPKKRRYGPETKFAKKRADHRDPQNTSQNGELLPVLRDETVMFTGGKGEVFKSVLLHAYAKKEDFNASRVKYKYKIHDLKFWTNIVLEINKREDEIEGGKPNIKIFEVRQRK